MFYGTVDEATAYFAERLHETAWTDADPSDRPKALQAATRIIDTLNFKGEKHSVWALLGEYRPHEPWPMPGRRPSPEQIHAANAAQELEFPRDSDVEVPEEIRIACFEIAHALLDGRDPELEVEALAITQQNYGSVQTSYSRAGSPLEHVANGVPSVMAWRLLRPFLRSSDEITFSRVS
jgi:hypothetical protein